MFSRLAVFAGGWTLEAAEAICAGGGIVAADVPDRLGHLVDHSLVVVEERAGRMRYRLLETMRQYAAEMLVETGESVTMAERHRNCLRSKAESSPFELFDPDHVTWLADELDNTRPACSSARREAFVERGAKLTAACGRG